MKTGFKATYNLSCRSHKFEIGQTYELPGIPIPCQYGFHYCQNPIDVLNYYPIRNDFRLLEVEDLGKSAIEQDKAATNKIRIVREIPKEEYYQLFGIVNNELTITGKYDFWAKYKFDEKNNLIRFEDSNGYYLKYEYDERNNKIYYENSSGIWTKREFDENNNEIYYENSDGGEKGVSFHFTRIAEDVEIAKQIFDELRCVIISLARMKHESVFKGDGAVYAEGFVNGLSSKLNVEQHKIAHENNTDRGLILSKRRNELIKRKTELAYIFLEKNSVKLVKKGNLRGGNGTEEAFEDGLNDGRNYDVSVNKTRKLACY